MLKLAWTKHRRPDQSVAVEKGRTTNRETSLTYMSLQFVLLRGAGVIPCFWLKIRIIQIYSKVAYNSQHLFSESPYCFCFCEGFRFYTVTLCFFLSDRKILKYCSFATLSALVFFRDAKLVFEFISRESRHHRSSVLNHTSSLWHQFHPIWGRREIDFKG